MSADATPATPSRPAGAALPGPVPSASDQDGRILITGAGGEVGRGLIEALHAAGEGDAIVACDLRELAPDVAAKVGHALTGDVRDTSLYEQLAAHGPFREIYHLAALLSSAAEKNPPLAHDVNVNGSVRLLDFALDQARRRGGVPVRFLYPSTIAVHGMGTLEQKRAAGAITENAYLNPITMYGINKLYIERLGAYYADHYGSLSDAPSAGLVDFRCIRYPGLLSAHTVPTGGTSDYGPEMIHAAARGGSEPYRCFVREDARIPFMTMQEAVEATLALARAPRESLTQRTYAVRSFAPTAGQIDALVRRECPDAPPTVYAPHPKRQAIVDSWPEDVDTTPASRDWGFAPRYDLPAAFRDYLLPDIRARYAASQT